MIDDDKIGTRPPVRPGSPVFVSSVERELDVWETESARYRLVERAGVYRLDVWDLYRWTPSEQGFQAVARRVSQLLRNASPESANVVSIEEGRQRSGVG